MELKTRIDFCIVISVDGANPNGDPGNKNRPRQSYDGYGEISDVCIKRKIRNRLQDMGENIFMQRDDRIDDGCKSLTDRAKSNKAMQDALKTRNEDEYTKIACENWIDVRGFGQVFPFKGISLSTHVRGCVSVGMARSLDVILIEDLNISKSLNLITTEGKDNSILGGYKYIVNHAAYVAYGSIFPQLAKINGFTTEDAEKFYEAITTLFDGDTSAARPTGTMNVQKVYWWTQNEGEKQYAPIQVFRTLDFKPSDEYPFFTVAETPLPDLTPLVYEL